MWQMTLLVDVKGDPIFWANFNIVLIYIIQTTLVLYPVLIIHVKNYTLHVIVVF